MSQKERVDLIEVDLLDMCKYILSKWIFILLGMVIFAGAGFGYAKVKSKTEYSSKMQVYVTVPKTSDKVLIRDNAGELATDYLKLLKTDLVTKAVSDKTGIRKEVVKDSISAELVDSTRILEITIKSDDKNVTKRVSQKILPIFQEIAVKKLDKNKPIIVNEPSRLDVSQSINTKKMLVLGGMGGFIVMVGIFFIKYLIDLKHKFK